jgi:hypothetical protein
MPPYDLPPTRELKFNPSPTLQTNFELLASHAGWRTTWSHIVAGNFSSAPHAGLFFYDQATGDAAIYSTDGNGQITQPASLPSWRAGWTHVVVGKFSDSPFTALFFYDQPAGVAAIYEVDGNANLKLLRQYSSWRSSWDQVTTVRVRGSAYTGIVLYDRAAGRGEIHQCTGHGNLQLHQASDGWRTTWSHVVGGYASGSSLLFYEAATGHCEIYQLTYDPNSTDPGTKDPNNLGPVVQADLPPATAIVPGNFGWSDTYLFYDRATGTANFVFMVYDAIQVVETHTGLPTTWDIITSGGFWAVDETDLHFPEGGFSDLLFYDRARGVGEFYLHEPPVSTPPQALAGYTSAGSVRAGQSLSFFVSSQVGPYTIKIYRQSTDEAFMGEMTGLPSAPTPLPIRRAAWRDGAGWPVAGTLQIPADWPSGLYLARVEAAGPTSLDIPFIVRPQQDRTQSRIVVAMNDTTYDAYNHWGGRSHYGYGSLGTLYFTSPGAGDGTMPWGYRVSMRRPQASVFAEYSAKWTYWEVPLAHWLAHQGIVVEWCTLVDIHADPGLLHRYAMLVNVGHNEYVSNEIREHVVQFVNAGGNAAFFGGNNCWWRIRFEDGTDVSACYKLASLDPLTDPNQQTVNWPAALSGEMQGVSWSGNVFAGDPHLRTDKFGLLQYSVVDAGHWVFAGTGLNSGDQFGVYGDGRTVVGSETDARTTQSPAGLKTVAWVQFHDPTSNAVSEVTTMVVFTRGGTVFDASTNDWTLGLSQDSNPGPIDQITRNVFDRLSPNWSHKDLSLVTGTPAAAGNLGAYEFTAEPTKHVVYRGGKGHIYELWWDSENGWSTGDLSSATGAPAAAGDPAGYQFVGDSTQHVVYRGTDQHIHELWWDAAHGWGHGDLTAVVGTPAATGDPSGYAFEAQKTQHVLYRGVDRQIYELWWDAASGWGGGSLTGATGASLAAGDPTGYVFAVDATQHVIYRGIDGHIHELWWSAATGWSHGDLTAATGAPAPQGDPAGYSFEAQRTQHVVYRSSDNHIYELWWDAAQGWGHGDLTAATQSVPAAGDPFGYLFDDEGTQHVVYRDAVGDIHELWWDAANGWSTGDLTAVSEGPRATGDPVGFAYRAQRSQHVFYRSADGHVHELRSG